MDEKIKVTNKCPICKRPTHKESKYCIFHASAEEKTEEDFKQALTKYVDKIKKENGYYDFKEFIFVGNINFKQDLNITVFKHVDFHKATFEGDVGFEGATFKGKARFGWTKFEGFNHFRNATFEGDADFSYATFKISTDFDEATFEGDADFGWVTIGGFNHFDEVTFKGYAYFGWVTIEGFNHFRNVTFEGDVKFHYTTFKMGADFYGAIFKGSVDFNGTNIKAHADFRETTFKGDADFSWATFDEDADFRSKNFFKILNFYRIKTLPGKKIFIRLNNEEGEISFERAYLENIYLDIELVKGTLIDFNGALLKNTKIKKGQIEDHILQEKREKFSEAKEIYLLLKNNFHSIGQYEDESWAFEKEKEMERKSLSFPYYKNTLKEEDKKEKFPILKWIKKGDLKKWIISGFQI